VWFRFRRCGYVVGLASRGVWGVGGGSLSAAGCRRWFKSEDAAEYPRPPLRRNSGETAEDRRRAGTAEPSVAGGGA